MPRALSCEAVQQAPQQMPMPMWQEHVMTLSPGQLNRTLMYVHEMLCNITTAGMTGTHYPTTTEPTTPDYTTEGPALKAMRALLATHLTQ